MFGKGDRDDEQRAGYRDAQSRLRIILAKSGKGSILRGWRCELDPDGLCELNFYDLCAAAARIGFNEDILLLYQADDDLRSFKLSTLVPDLAKLFDKFREWVKEEFFTPSGFFNYLDSTAHTGNVTAEEFGAALQRRNFAVTTQEQAELFGMCDGYGTGIVTHDDLIVLETDAHVRDQELFKIRTKSQQQRQRFLASVYLSDCERNVKPTHRQAPRAWHSSKFERLPTVEAQRREEWQLEKQRREANAFSHFTQELREQYGCEVRAWRRGLDPDAKFSLKSAEIRRYCRKMNSSVDVNNLQKHLDSNCEGRLVLEEFCPHPAAILARFRHWAQSICGGSVASLWEREEVVRTRRTHTKNGSWASDKKMLRGALGSVLREMEWEEVSDNDARHTVLQALDLLGCGFVSREDLEWLDKWSPPEWMCAVPNMESCRQLKALLLEKYGHALAAWRQVLDVDDSNSISWAEFVSACETVGFSGDVPGAWRAIDVDLSGSISMWEYDTESAELLSSFKAWIDLNFGSVRLAFKAFDSDGGGSVSLPELRRICHELRWDGDVHEIFNCLDRATARDAEGNTIGKAHLTMSELAFLDSWKVELAPEEELALEVIDEEEEETPASAFGRRRSLAHGLTSPPTRFERRMSAAPLLQQMTVAAERRASEISAYVNGSATQVALSDAFARRRSLALPRSSVSSSEGQSPLHRSASTGVVGMRGRSKSTPNQKLMDRPAVRRGTVFGGSQSGADLLGVFRLPPLQGWSAGRKSETSALISGVALGDPFAQQRQQRRITTTTTYASVTELPSPPGSRGASRGTSRSASCGAVLGHARSSQLASVSFHDAPTMMRFDNDTGDDLSPSRLPSRGSSRLDSRGSSRLDAIAW